MAIKKKKNETAIRKVVTFYDEIDAVLGCRNAITLKHLKETGATSSAISSADSDSPLNLSAESSREKALHPKETATPPKSSLERKKGQGKRKCKVNDAEDGDGDEHFSQAFDEIKSQGERIASSLEKMQEMQIQQMNCMNQFMADFLKGIKGQMQFDTHNIIQVLCYCLRSGTVPEKIYNKSLKRSNWTYKSFICALHPIILIKISLKAGYP